MIINAGSYSSGGVKADFDLDADSQMQNIIPIPEWKFPTRDKDGNALNPVLNITDAGTRNRIQASVQKVVIPDHFTTLYVDSLCGNNNGNCPPTLEEIVSGCTTLYPASNNVRDYPGLCRMTFTNLETFEMSKHFSHPIVLNFPVAKTIYFTVSSAGTVQPIQIYAPECITFGGKVVSNTNNKVGAYWNGTIVLPKAQYIGGIAGPISGTLEYRFPSITGFFKYLARTPVFDSGYAGTCNLYLGPNLQASGQDFDSGPALNNILGRQGDSIMNVHTVANSATATLLTEKGITFTADYDYTADL